MLDDDPDLTLARRATAPRLRLRPRTRALPRRVVARARVVRRLRLAYRSVGVSIDDTASEAGAERTTFTCPYRDVGARIYGEKWVCHEKLDRVDDGYVTYLAKRGIDYQRPPGCDGSEVLLPPSCATGLSCGGRRPPRGGPRPPRDPRSSRVAVDTVATALRGRVATGGGGDEPAAHRIQRAYAVRARVYDWFARATASVGGVRAGCVRALDLDPGDTVVEFGCGPGVNVPALREAVGPTGHVVVVDITGAMLDRARGYDRAPRLGERLVRAGRRHRPADPLGRRRPRDVRHLPCSRTRTRP